MPDSHANLIRQAVTAVASAGLGAVTLGAAQVGRKAFVAGDDGKSFAVRFQQGTDSEVATGCVYTHNGGSSPTLTRGTLESSTTGSRLTLTTAAVVSTVLPASLGNRIEDLLTNPHRAATAASWSTSWDMTGFKDLGTFTITGALALTSNDANSVRGGCTQAVLIANGTNAPTFDGASHADWNNTNNAANLVQLVRVGGYKFWFIGAVAGTAVTAAEAPAFSVGPVCAGAALTVPVTWTAAVATGYPTPTITYDILVNDVEVATNTTSGSYTPVTNGGSLVVRATATNASGSATASSTPVTIAAAPTAPGAPTSLAAGTATTTTQLLTWTAPASNGGAAITGYKVGYRAPAGTGAYTYVSTGSTSTSHTVTGLTAATEYEFVVRAVNSVGDGTISAAITASTAAAPSSVVVRQFDKTSNVTETGNGTAGWNYENSNGYGNNFTDLVSMVGDKKLPSGADGWFEVTLGGTWSGGQAPHIGVTTTKAKGAYSVCAVGCYADSGSGVNYVRSEGPSAGSATDTAVAYAQGDIVRFERTGSAWALKISKNGGTSYTTAHTWTGQTTADVWLHVCWGGANRQVNNLRGSSNVVT